MKGRAVPPKPPDNATNRPHHPPLGRGGIHYPNTKEKLIKQIQKPIPLLSSHSLLYSLALLFF